MDFPKIYRLCRRTHALDKGVSAVKDRLSSRQVPFTDVEVVKINSFRDVHGYKVILPEGTAFFPKGLSELSTGSGVSWMRDIFSQADIVIPPYYFIGFLERYAAEINRVVEPAEKMRIGDRMLFEMYPPDGLAELIDGVWSARKTFDQFHSQLVESAKAYCLGLYNIAIVGLLPCIEGIVRRLGTASGMAVDKEVGITTLTKVFSRLQKQEVRAMMQGYDWYPENEITVSLLDNFHERVQMLGNISSYLNSRLYLHTNQASPQLTLNRHGISHGFFHGYANPENYLRLFNLLNALSFAAILVEGKGSLMHPGSTPGSIDLTNKLLKCAMFGPAIR